jgi:trk system potassium uptake protein TrkA
MRAVFVGASTMAIMTARILPERGHEVVIIERDKVKIDALFADLACGFLHGDGSKPVILREAEPAHADVLYCLTGNDQTNILASLVGRSLGFPRVVTKIDDSDFEHICIELGLKDTIIPARTIGRYLADMFQGLDPLELSALIRDEARTFSFVFPEGEGGLLRDVDLPGQSRVVCVYHNGKFVMPDETTRLKPGAEVVVVTHRNNLPALRERWAKSRPSPNRRSLFTSCHSAPVLSNREWRNPATVGWAKRSVPINVGADSRWARPAAFAHPTDLQITVHFCKGAGEQLGIHAVQQLPHLRIARGMLNTVELSQIRPNDGLVTLLVKLQ